MVNKLLIVALVVFSIILIGILIIGFFWNGSFKKKIGPNENPENLICSCSADTMNCGDFAIQRDAQECFEFCGGASNDIHGLDADGNGQACESLG